MISNDFERAVIMIDKLSPSLSCLSADDSFDNFLMPSNHPQYYWHNSTFIFGRVRYFWNQKNPSQIVRIVRIVRNNCTVLIDIIKKFLKKDIITRTKRRTPQKLVFEIYPLTFPIRLALFTVRFYCSASCGCKTSRPGWCV